MANPTYKYNPGFLSDEDSVNSFVVRHKDFNLLHDVLVENTQASSNRHILVVGPRGSGKSTLARRLIAETRTNSSLAADWYSVSLGEESYAITSPGEFWLESVFHLAEQTSSSELKGQYLQIRSEKNDTKLRELALGALVSFSTKIQKKILLVVENFNVIMEDQMDESQGWEIRHSLQNVPEVMLLATATKRFDQTIDKALFEQFKVHELRPLTQSEVSTLWGALARESLPLTKIRPIQILTGGSPRLITILSEFAVSHSFTNLMARLTSLIDQYTDYFKSQLDALATVERKVFVAVLEKWDPATTREIADESRLPVNLASAQLARLKTRGAVQKRSIKSTQYWEASERLFNLYYLMRRRGAPSSRVHALIRFMTIYYESDQLYERAADLAKECSSLDPNLRQDHYAVLTHIMRSFDEIRQAELLKLTPPDFQRFLEKLGTATRASSQRRAGSSAPLSIEKRVLSLIKEGKTTEAVELLETDTDSGTEHAALWAFIGVTVGAKEKSFDLGMAYVERALSLDAEQSAVWFFKGVLLNNNKHFAEAIQALEMAAKLDPQDADIWIAMGNAKSGLNDLKAAEAAYRTAVKLEDAAGPWHALGGFLAYQKYDQKGGEDALRKAAQLEPLDSNYVGPLGVFLLRHSKVEEAEKLFRGILERDAKDGAARSFLLRALRAKDRPRAEIDREFQTAISILAPKKRLSTRVEYARFLNEVHEHGLAEKILGEATIENPQSGRAWLELAKQISIDTDRRTEALEAFGKALDRSPKNGQIWAEFGSFVSSIGEDNAKAEEALRKAVSISPNRCAAWQGLGAHLAKTGEIEEASRCFERALDVNPRCFCAMDDYALVLAKEPAGLERATHMLEEFVGRVPDTPYPHVALAKLLLSAGSDREEAIEQLFVALKKGATPSTVAKDLVRALDLQKFGDAVRLIDRYLAAAHQDAESKNRIAWSLLAARAPKELLAYAIKLSKEAVEAVDSSWDFRHTLACLSCEVGEGAETLEQVRWLTDHYDQRFLSDLIELSIRVARGGASARLLKVLSGSRAQEDLEPLLIALQMGDEAHEEPNVASEILQVAQDIRRQILAPAKGSDGPSIAGSIE